MRHAFLYQLAPVAAVTIALVGCGGGGDDDDGTPVVAGPTLTALGVQATSHNGEALEPAFHPNVRTYTLRVQSDIYGVLLQPAASSGVTVTVEAGTTAGAYSATNPSTDTATPEAVPYANSYGPYGHMVKLSESYASYDVTYTQTATLKLSDAAGSTSQYTVNIVRDNDTAIYRKFGDEKLFAAANGQTVKYRIYYPPNYQTSTKRYPVVLALHGGGQVVGGGQPSDMVLKKYKQATVWAQDSEENAAKEAIVIAPQVAGGYTASGDTSTLSPQGQAIYELLDDVTTRERVNPNRVYLVGLSLGGFGVFGMTQTYPTKFAAMYIGSTSASGTRMDWSIYKRYFDGKIRLFQAVDDPVAAFSAQQNVATQLTAVGAAFETNRYGPGTFFYPTAHFAWTPAYADRSAREWLFSQTK